MHPGSWADPTCPRSSCSTRQLCGCTSWSCASRRAASRVRLEFCSDALSNVPQGFVLVVVVTRPDAAEAVSVPPWHDVQMQVEDRLLGCITRGRDQVHALG